MKEESAGSLIRLLGGFRIETDSGRSVSAGKLPKAAREIIKMIALDPSGAIDRDVLTARLWPDMEPPAARNKLYKNLHFIRVTLDTPRPLVGPSAGQVALDASVRVDVREFESAADQALRPGGTLAQLEHALSWYRGGLLPGDDDTDWLARSRLRLSGIARSLRLTAATACVAQGDLPRAIDVLTEQAVDDPCDEECAEALITAHVRNGATTRARRRYEQLSEALRDELDVEPSPRIRALVERLDLVPAQAGDSERRPPLQYVRTADDVRIAYWRRGGGELLIQLPMGQLSHIQMELELPWMRAWYEQMARRFTLVRYDMRGFGASDWHSIGPDCQVRDLAAVVESMGEPVTLFATLTQGRVAVQYAASAPERVKRLILWNPAPPAGAFGNQAEALVRGMPVEDWAAFVNAWGISIWGWRRAEQARLWARLTVDSTNRQNLDEFVSVEAQLDVTEIVGNVRCPVLLVRHARYEGSVEASERYLAAIPHARPVTLNGIYAPWVDLSHTAEALEIIDQFTEEYP